MIVVTVEVVVIVMIVVIVFIVFIVVFVTLKSKDDSLSDKVTYLAVLDS